MKMKKEKINQAITFVINNSFVNSIDKRKREVNLELTEELFDAISDILKK